MYLCILYVYFTEYLYAFIQPLRYVWDVTQVC